jgi:hypothetical protein
VIAVAHDVAVADGLVLRLLLIVPNDIVDGRKVFLVRALRAGMLVQWTELAGKIGLLRTGDRLVAEEYDLLTLWPIQPTHERAASYESAGMAQTVCIFVSASDHKWLGALVADRNRQRKHVERAGASRIRSAGPSGRAGWRRGWRQPPYGLALAAVV